MKVDGIVDRRLRPSELIHAGFSRRAELPIDARLPHHSTLSLFRTRIGAAGFVKLFDEPLGMARAYGLVSDTLRLKDATHIYADIAVPTAMGLFAQLRDRMLAAACTGNSTTVTCGTS